MEWLHILGLEQYYNTLSHQGYDDLDKVTDITWEDLEEIGIQKLGQLTTVNYITPAILILCEFLE